MVAGAGFEPTTFGLWARRATRLLQPALTGYVIIMPAEYKKSSPNKNYISNKDNVLNLGKGAGFGTFAISQNFW